MTTEEEQINASASLSVVVGRRERRLKSGLHFNLQAQGIESFSTGVAPQEYPCSEQGHSKLERNMIASGLAQQFAFDLVHNAVTYQGVGKRSALQKEKFDTAQTMCPEEDGRWGCMTDARCSSFTQRGDTSFTDSRCGSITDARCSSFTQCENTSFADMFTEGRFTSFEGRITSQTTSSAGFSVPGQPWGNERESRTSTESRLSMSSISSSMSSDTKQVAMKEALRSLRSFKRRFVKDKTKYHSGPPSASSSRRPSAECDGPDSSNMGGDSRIIFHTPSLASLQKDRDGRHGVKLPICKREGDGAPQKAFRIRRVVPPRGAGFCSTPPYFASQPADFGFPSSSTGATDTPPARQTFETESVSRSSYSDSQNGSFVADRIFSSSTSGVSGVFSGTSSGSATPQRGYGSTSSCPALVQEGEEHEPSPRTSDRGSMLPSRCFQTMPPIREVGDDGDNDSVPSGISGLDNTDMVLGEFA